tara:strand:- start:2110 stop:2310 length:201 start_codon:yes stop_codon:yes gene_type:complete
MQFVMDNEGRRVWIDGADGYNALSDNQKSKLDTKPMRKVKSLKVSIEQCRRFGSAYQQNKLNQSTK